MASTYSSLKIQLMTTGENSGTWGTVTNTNLGTAIEEAIVGSSDVTFASADVTLTLTDTNATQSARNLRLNLTGTVAAPQNLIVPAIEKIYIINNGLTQTITVKNSTGTGIAVPAGKTMYVYNNATNVVDAITHLTSLTLGTPLAVADGGTGSNTATFSGANITSLNASNVSSGTLANARTTAASANGASTIVARDANGSFAANVVTTTTVSGDGSGLTSLNASNVSSGTLANARTTAASANGASTIVARDASGGFSAGVITANGSSITAINANNISTGTLAVGQGGTGATTLTAENVIIGNTTGAVKFVAPGTSGNILTSNGSAWLSQAAASSGITAGTMSTFTSPGTWTKPASVKFVRVTVVASGGVFNSPGSGSTGNTSSFGPFVSCTGGTGNGPNNPGPVAPTPKAGGTSTGADWNFSGTVGYGYNGGPAWTGVGGGSLLTISPQYGGASPTGNIYGGGSWGASAGPGCNPIAAGAGGGGSGIKYISAPSIPGPVAVTVGAGATPSPTQNASGGGIVIIEEFS